MGDEVKRLRPAQQTLQEVNLEAENINLNTDEIEQQQIDGTQQTQITDGVTTAGVAAATQGMQVDLVGLAGADVDAGAGNKSAQTQRVTLADDDTNLAALVAKMTDKLQMIQVTDGTNQAAVIAAILSLKTDLSSIAGVVTPVGDGAVDAGTQRMTLANDDVLTLAIKNAMELIDDIVATFGAAAVAKGAQLAALGKDLVPVAVAEGQAVAVLADLIGQIIIKGYNRATGSLDASIVAQTKIPPIIEDGWVALAAAGDMTPHRDVRMNRNHSVSWDITIGTLVSMGLRIWCTLDEAGALPLLLADFNVLAAGVLEDLMTFENLQIVDIWGELQAENGAADGSVVFAYAGGN